MKLIKSVSLENLVAQRNNVITLVEEARQTLLKAQALARTHKLGELAEWIGADRYDSKSVDLFKDNGMTRLSKCLDSKAWNHLMVESGLKSFMDTKARTDWSESIERGNFPELSVGAIKQTFIELHAKRYELLERGVINVFKGLSWDYKTNNPFMFGKKIILNRFGNFWYQNNFSVCTRMGDSLDDLVRVFSLLESKPEPDNRNGIYSQISSIKNSSVFDLEYFSIKVYMKGTGHVTFKRPDLIEKVNGIIAKHYPGALGFKREA